MKVQIILAGVGGQGVLFATRVFSQVAMTKELSNLRLSMELQGASNMIGSQVAGESVAGEQTEGIVQSVTVKDGKTYLELTDLSRIALEDVTDVSIAGF